VAARRFNVKYTVLDDMKDDLDDLFKGENLKQSEDLMRMIYGKNPTVE